MKVQESDFFTSVSVKGSGEDVALFDMWDILDLVHDVTVNFACSTLLNGPGTSDKPLLPKTSQEWFYVSRKRIVQLKGAEYDESNLNAIAGVHVKLGSHVMMFDVAKRYAHFRGNVVEEDVVIGSTTVSPNNVLSCAAQLLPEETIIMGVRVQARSFEHMVSQISAKMTGEESFSRTILHAVVVPANVRAIIKYTGESILQKKQEFVLGRTESAKAIIDSLINSALLSLAITIIRSFNNSPVKVGLAYSELLLYLDGDLDPILRGLEKMSSSDNIRKIMSDSICGSFTMAYFFIMFFNWVIFADGVRVLNYFCDRVAELASEPNSRAMFTSDSVLIAEMRDILRGECTTVTEKYVSIIVAAWLCAETSRFDMNFLATYCLMDCIEKQVKCPNGRENYTVYNSLTISPDVQVRFVDAHGFPYKGKGLAKIRGYHPMVHFTSFLQTKKYDENGIIPDEKLPIAMQKTACIVMQWLALCLSTKSDYTVSLDKSIRKKRSQDPPSDFKICISSLMRDFLDKRIRSLCSYDDFLI